MFFFQSLTQIYSEKGNPIQFNPIHNDSTTKLMATGYRYPDCQHIMFVSLPDNIDQDLNRKDIILFTITRPLKHVMLLF